MIGWDDDGDDNDAGNDGVVLRSGMMIGSLDADSQSGIKGLFRGLYSMAMVLLLLCLCVVVVVVGVVTVVKWRVKTLLLLLLLLVVVAAAVVVVMGVVVLEDMVALVKDSSSFSSPLPAVAIVDGLNLIFGLPGGLEGDLSFGLDGCCCCCLTSVVFSCCSCWCCFGLLTAADWRVGLLLTRLCFGLPVVVVLLRGEEEER
jgi:uncharacterized membrane protein